MLYLSREAAMITNKQILDSTSISASPFEGRAEIWVTRGHQLFGDYSALKTFRSSYRKKNSAEVPYMGWEAHHIVEKQDLERLGVASRFPDPEHQLCVLLPREAHVGRINNMLRNRNPSRYSATAEELLSAYREAYDLVGDYSGAGAPLIKSELLGVVQAVVRLARAGTG
jgi:hypothetical protein